MKPTVLKVGMVVQLAPGPDTFFGGCFMLVTEPKPWGAQGFVAIPGHRGEVPRMAFCRPTWDKMELIGAAVWVPAPEASND